LEAYIRLSRTVGREAKSFQSPDQDPGPRDTLQCSGSFAQRKP